MTIKYMKNLAVFINSSDGFDDCWDPFFKLYCQFAKDLCGIPVYLNTERKDYSWTGLKISSTMVSENDSGFRLTWSECLQRGLNKIEEPYILYLQEDYFLNGNVDIDLIKESLEMIRAQPDVGVVYLNSYGPQFQNVREINLNFVEILPPVNYLLSTQAAIWRKDVLISLICPWENGWMFEKFGSCRARKLKKRFLSLSKSLLSERNALDYVYTGIIKGKWNTKCVDLFRSQNILIDFSRRGFYKDSGRLKSRMEVIKKIFSHPVNAFRSVLTLF